ncbi:unnamed protein product, partial [Hermetia illucens]
IEPKRKIFVTEADRLLKPLTVG